MYSCLTSKVNIKVCSNHLCGNENEVVKLTLFMDLWCIFIIHNKYHLMYCMICGFLRGVGFVHKRMFHSFGNIINGEKLQILKYTLHWWPLTHAKPLLWSYPRSRETHTFSRAFVSGAVKTCIDDLGIEPRSNDTPLRYRGGCTICENNG